MNQVPQELTVCQVREVYQERQVVVLVLVHPDRRVNLVKEVPVVEVLLVLLVTPAHQVRIFTPMMS